MSTPKLLWAEPAPDTTNLPAVVEPTLALPVPDDPPTPAELVPQAAPDPATEQRAYEELLAFIAANKDPDSEVETMSPAEFAADA